jgi:hypothetical protein
MTRLTAPILCLTAWSALSVGPQVPSVKNAAELRAQRTAEVERARFFDADGTPLAQMGDLVKITPGGEPIMVVVPPGSKETRGDILLRGSVCTSKAILVGSPISFRALLNRQETQLFTTWSVQVETWIYPERRDVETLIAHRGGSAYVNGALWWSQSHFDLRVGKRYVFFLMDIPGGDAFAPGYQPLPVADDRVSEGQYAGSAINDASDVRSVVAALRRIRSECGRR